MVRNATKQTKTNATPGFAIEIKDDTELGIAMLIAEDEEGHYQPVASVININEGREIAQSDLRRRMRELERGNDPGLCPYCYRIWATGLDGDYRVAAELLATSL
jgi:hypothetical protein